MQGPSGQGLANKPYEPNFVPKFWTGSFPDTVDPKEIVYNCGGSLPAADDDFKHKVLDVYERKGIVWV